jgi:hypothetical protein
MGGYANERACSGAATSISPYYNLALCSPWCGWRKMRGRERKMRELAGEPL